MELLKHIDSNDIDVLIKDLELLDNEYVINYIIDPHDIFKFTFPYGIRFDKDKSKPLDEIGDEMISYSYIFNNYKPIILDEYKFELFTSRNNIYTNLSEQTNSNLFDELIERFEEYTPEKRKHVYDELSKSASFLLSTALLTKSFLKQFDDIFHNKLQIDSFHLKNRNINDENIILETFRKNKRSDWSKIAFEKWTNSRKGRSYLRRRSLVKSPVILTKIYTDFVVLDRVCNINRQLQTNNDLVGRYLFLYFSSAPKSAGMFSQKITKEHLPNINGTKNYDILRNIKHSYLLFLFWDPDRNKFREDLEKLKKIADNREKANLLEKIEEADKDLVERIREKKRAFLETESIKLQINKHKNFQELLTEKIKDLKEKENDPFELSKLYKSLLEDAIVVKENIGLLDFDLSYSVQSKLSILIDYLIEKKELSLHKGLDAIKGNYHHLPILLFLNENFSEDDKLISFLHKVIEYVVKSPKIRSESIDDFFTAIKELYAESEIFKRADLNFVGILVKSLIYLILPYKDRADFQESEAHTFISDTYTTLKYRKDLFEKWKCDYLYFLIWANRRNNLIDESLELAEQAIRECPKDPRFYHGKCLALYNKYVNSDNLEIGNFYNLELLVKSAETAIDLYKGKIGNQHYRQRYDQFISGSIIALQNTILYCLSLYYLDILERNVENNILNNSILSKYSLKYLRDRLLNPIKSSELKKNQSSKDFPELAHTESVLELCEAISDFNNSVRSNKISEASRAIERALEIESTSILYKKTKKKIEKWRVILKD